MTKCLCLLCVPNRSAIVARRLSVPFQLGKKKENAEATSPLASTAEGAATPESPTSIPPGGDEIVQRTDSIVTSWWQGDWNAFVALSTPDCTSILPGQGTQAIKVCRGSSNIGAVGDDFIRSWHKWLSSSCYKYAIFTAIFIFAVFGKE